VGAAHRVNDLSGMSELGLNLDTANRSLPAREVKGDYCRRYKEHFGLNAVRPVIVRSVANR
jgi:hypothetical protein